VSAESRQRRDARAEPDQSRVHVHSGGSDIQSELELGQGLMLIRMALDGMLFDIRLTPETVEAVTFGV
jgi:hypothetical protein